MLFSQFPTFEQRMPDEHNGSLYHRLTLKIENIGRKHYTFERETLNEKYKQVERNSTITEPCTFT